MEELKEVLRRLSPAQLKALHGMAKNPTRGVRPFFTDPRAMIVLRTEAERSQK